jgi:hypothetical protein
MANNQLTGSRKGGVLVRPHIEIYGEHSASVALLASWTLEIRGPEI